MNQYGDSNIQDFDLKVLKDSEFLIDDFSYEISPLFEGWSIPLGSASGEVKTVYDIFVKSRVMETTTVNGINFRIDRNGEWDRNTFFVKLKAYNPFIFFSKGIDSTGQEVTIQYTPDEGSSSKKANYVYIHIGTRFNNGNWNVLSRDINEDLRSVNWGSTLQKITAFMVRGPIRMDDLIVGNYIYDTNASVEAFKVSYKNQNYPSLWNYPNPFNSNTIINYNILVPSKVQLEVFNLLGQRIEIIEMGNIHESGLYTVAWNGENEQGNKVSSGIYFIRLTLTSIGDGHVNFLSKKIVVLK
jgi:hypothetical protein